MAARYSACEIVELAIQIEKNGKRFYSDIKKKTDSAEAREAFDRLAKDEDEHLKAFNEIFNGVCDYSPEGAYPDEYFSFMNSLASEYIFTEENRAVAENYTEALDLGIKMEKDSILFYQEMKKMVPERSRDTIDRIITEEKGHFRKLCDLKGGC
jgi:rubrerythrin